MVDGVVFLMTHQGIDAINEVRERNGGATPGG